MNRYYIRIMLAVACAVVCAAGAPRGFSQQSSGRQKAQATGQAAHGQPAQQPGTSTGQTNESNRLSLEITNEQLQALGQRIVATQHKNDIARDQYERIEHHVVTAGSERHLTEDKTYRVIPTGSGTMKITIRNGPAMADPAAYRQQLQDTIAVLQISVNPNDSRQKAAAAKAQKKSMERKDLVDAALRVFKAKLVGREMRGSQLIDILELDPDPTFQPHSLAEDALMHTRAKIWVQDATGQILHGDAEVVRDVSFGGGFLGKLYRGTHVSADNMEVGNDLFLPRRGQFDYSGRKFIFMFDTHESTEVSHYQLVGTSADVLAMLQRELAGGAAVPADP